MLAPTFQLFTGTRRSPAMKPARCQCQTAPVSNHVQPLSIDADDLAGASTPRVSHGSEQETGSTISRGRILEDI